MSEDVNIEKLIDDIINGDVAKQIKNNEDFLKPEYYLEEDLEQNSGEIFTEYLRKLQNENTEVELNIKLKKEYSKKIYRFMCIWVIVVFVIIISDSITLLRLPINRYISFDMSDNVLVTLIGGTTVSVIGLVGFIIKGLFPESKISKNEKE